jgi:SAM-dependent methyltransferase
LVIGKRKRAGVFTPEMFKMEKRVYRVLDNPWLFELSQHVFAPGAVAAITGHISDIINQLPKYRVILDVGCGPSSWLNRVGLKPIGIDLSRAYVRAYCLESGPALVASADAIPFRSGSIEGVWSIGLMHHLPDNTASAAILEFMRICGSPGYVVVLDGVLPDSSWRRPVAALFRRMDRGRFMRSQTALESLLPNRADWAVRRFTYSATGLEGVICLHVKK